MARAAAERSVVDSSVRVQRVVPEVDEVDPEVALSLSDPEDALVQIRPDGVWKECQNGAVQGAPAAKKG